MRIDIILSLTLFDYKSRQENFKFPIPGRNL